jgi:metal-dependent amidase/aminoacylase/carboxypeptidase family protein
LSKVCRKVEIDFSFKRGYDAVVNDSEAVNMMTKAASSCGKVVPAQKALAGEDFFYYAKEGASSCFCFVGSALPGPLRAHHHPAFDIDERSLSISVKIFLNLVEQNCL